MFFASETHYFYVSLIELLRWKSSYWKNPVAVKNIFDQAVRRKPRKHFSDDLKDQGICEWVVYKNPRMLEYVPDHFKTREMCNDAVIEDPYPLQFVPDWFVTQQQLKKWYDYWNYELIEWYKGYKKRKAQKAQIKKELMPIA